MGSLREMKSAYFARYCCRCAERQRRAEAFLYRGNTKAKLVIPPAQAAGAVFRFIYYCRLGAALPTRVSLALAQHCRLVTGREGRPAVCKRTYRRLAFDFKMAFQYALFLAAAQLFDSLRFRR